MFAPVVQPQVPDSEWPTEEFEAITAQTAGVPETHARNTAPGDEETQILPKVGAPPADGPAPNAERADEQLVLSVLSDPWDIAFRDRLLANLRRITGFR
jgi:hypothetical protein